MNDQAAQVIKHIADKLDLPVQHLWAGLIAYAPFTFWQWAVGVGIGLFLALCCVVLCVLCIKNKGTDGVIWWGGWTVGVMTVTAAFAIQQMPDALAAKYAPEAWASQYVIRRATR